ncbi:MAG: type II toxin-antitoxin system VapC family toxin [Planctomycetota bacterium]
MTHLFDTNSCVDHLRRGQAANITVRLVAAAAGSVVLCSVVVAELLYGAHRSSRKQQNLSQVQLFFRQFQSLPFDDRAADEYGRIRAHLAGLGMLIGPNDLLIASIALANGLTLVTHNTREFSRIPGLKLEDWQ